MTKTYHIEIVKQNDGVKPNTHYAHAFGDLDTVNYVAKKAIKELEGVAGNITLNLNEVDAIGGNVTREVVALAANAKVVTTVLKGELISERKAAKSEPAEDAHAAGQGMLPDAPVLDSDENPDADLPEVSLPIDPVDGDPTTEHFAGEYDAGH